MKNLYVKSITVCITVMVFCIAAFVSCTKYPTKKNGTIIEACQNVVCYNGGTCLDGRCNCPAGFSGADCQDLWNTSYTGTYEANDQCDVLNKYFVTIGTGGGNANQISVNGVSKFCQGITLQGVINPDNSTVNYALQRFCDYIYISGTSTQTQDKGYINMWLTARDSNAHVTSNCSIILRKL
jgi:hypothetical protein